VLLRPVDVGPGRAVDDAVEPTRARRQLAEQRRDGRLVGDVELGEVDQHELMAAALPRARHVVAEHSLSAGDQDPHRIEMSELSPTMNRYARG
jgi:hypothetical protein